MFSGFFIGLLFGFLLQRGQFCFVSGFRQLLFQKDLRFLTALLCVVSLQSIGLFSLQAADLILLPTQELPLIATILGGILFGVGMVLANVCGCGTWFRSAEGAIGSYISLVVFAITLVAAQAGAIKNWLQPLLQQTVAMNTIQDSLHISPWWLVACLCLITLGLIIYQFRTATFHFNTALKPQHLSLFLTALCLGFLGIIAWWASAQTGRNYGFGIAVPTAHVLQYITTGQQRYLNWGTGFVLGIFISSFITAKYYGEFTFKIPVANQFFRRVIGGIAMGIGATLAGGCTVTNTLVATAYFSWQGWIATFCILFGFWLTEYLIQRKN